MADCDFDCAFFECEGDVHEFRSHLVYFPTVEFFEVGNGAEMVFAVADFALRLAEKCESIFVFVLWFVLPKLQNSIFSDC